MATINTEILLNNLENQVESHLKVAVGVFQNLSGEILLKPSATKGWSIAQCLEHLNSYGDYYLPEFEKGLSQSTDNQIPKTFKSTWLGKLAIDSMNPTTGKKKFKAFKNHKPSTDLNAQKVVAKFINQQEQLLQIIRNARTKNIQKIKVRISIAKFLKLNLGDALQFLIVHNERHIQQAKRNL
ncbi:MAG: DinB family protein [Spirosomaceae bacterium]|nr:DinB family protein [Spirosomataceae bacterium]